MKKICEGNFFYQRLKKHLRNSNFPTTAFVNTTALLLLQLERKIIPATDLH